MSLRGTKTEVTQLFDAALQFFSNEDLTEALNNDDERDDDDFI